jgi:iron(III) transport system permease protein
MVGVEQAVASHPTTEGRPRPAKRVAARRQRQRWTPFQVAGAATALVFAALAVYPIGRVLVRLFVSDGRVDLSPIKDVFAQDDLWKVLGNTVLVVGCSTTVAVVVGSVMAWLNERTNARVGVLTDFMPILPFLLPAVAGSIAWVLLLSDRSGLLNAWLRDLLDHVGIHLTEGPFNINTYWGLIFVYSIYSVPFVYMLVSAGLRNLDPALEEQSRVAGASAWHTVRHVTLPGIRPSLAAGVLLALWAGLSLFSVPTIIGTPAKIDVLAVRVVQLTRDFPPRTGVAVGMSLFVVLAVGVTYALQIRIVRRARHATIGGKGSRAQRIDLGRWRWPARLLLLGYVLVAVVLPILALLVVALNGYWTPHIAWDSLKLDAFRQVLFRDTITRDAIFNSLQLSVIGASIGMLAAALIATTVRRRASRTLQVLATLIKLPAVVSALVVGVGCLVAFSGQPFDLQGTLIILLLGYLLISMPQGSLAADTAASQVGSELSEASAVSGAGGGRTFWRVSLPLMIPGLLAGWALMFARIAEDLTVSAMLSSTGNIVVGQRILEIYTTGSYAKLAALALILTSATAVVVCGVMAAGRHFGTGRSRSARRRSTRIGGRADENDA